MHAGECGLNALEWACRAAAHTTEDWCGSIRCMLATEAARRRLETHEKCVKASQACRLMRPRHTTAPTHGTCGYTRPGRDPTRSNTVRNQHGVGVGLSHGEARK